MAPPAGPSALVAEPSVPVANALRRFLTQAGFAVTVVHFVDDAILQSRKVHPDVVFAAVSRTFHGEQLCVKLKKLKPHGPVVLTYAPELAEAMVGRAQQAGADAWLMTPLKGAVVVSAALSMVRLHGQLRRIDELELELTKAHTALQAHSGTNTHDLQFFKKFLTLEVKRSKRYQYPLAFMMVALDGLEERLSRLPLVEQMRATIRAEALGAIASLLRDIDLCVPFTDDRLLVFLPHTPREGAMTVSARLVARLATLQTFEGGFASIGLSTFDPKAAGKPSVGFGSLMREASLNLRLAQEAGGNRVEATPMAMAAKRDRVSIA